MQLFDYQQAALDRVAGKRRCAFYHDMGLGKTFTGSAKLMDMRCWLQALVVCQKSKVGDWIGHFEENYDVPVVDLTTADGMAKLEGYVANRSKHRVVFVINYDLLHRRSALESLRSYAVMFDESSLLQNTSTKRTRAAMYLASKANGVILLSGTPTDGKYERLWTQMRMLGWGISEKLYMRQYVDIETKMVEGFPIRKVLGYKNETRLVNKMKSLGCDFLKTDEVLDLPDQRFVDVWCDRSDAYAKFAKANYVEAYGREFVGDTVFGAMTAARLLAGAYSETKAQAFKDVVQGTSERLVVFYNFNDELDKIRSVLDVCGRPVSVLNGTTHDLVAFRSEDDGVAVVQYQAGAMGVNLQEARYAVYFSPPLASSLFEQSKKRIHRVGQDRPCTYYMLRSSGTIEQDIYANLAKRRDYTEKLFEMGSALGG